MTAAGQNLLIRVAVADAASIPAEKIAASIGGIGLEARAAAAQSSSALAQVDAALAGTAARAIATGEANTAGALAASGAWSRAAGVIRTTASTAAAAFASESERGVRAAEEAAARSGSAYGAKFGAKMGESAKAIAAPILATIGIFALADFVKESVRAATDEESAIRRLNLIFGEGSEVVKTYSETTAKGFNYTGAAAMSMASDFGNAFSAFNITGARAAEMSTNLVSVVADLSKATGKSRGEVEDAVQSAIKGRPKLLQEMGIAFDAATLKQEALNHSIGNGVTALTASQKMMVDYFAVLDGAKKDTGAYAAANDTAANKMDRLNLKADELKVKLGTGLLPLFGSFADVASNGVIPALEGMLWPVEKLLGLFGKLPAPIEAAVITFGTLLALKGPIGTFFDFILLKAATVTEALGAEGLAMSMLGLAGAMGPIVAVAGGVAIALTMLGDSDKAAANAADNHATAVGNLSAALQASNGFLDENVRKTALSAIENAKWGKSSTDLSTYAASLKGVGITSRDLVNDTLGLDGAQYKVESGYKRQVDLLEKIINANIRRVSAGRGGTAGIENETGQAAQKTLDILNQQHDAFAGLIGVQSDAAVKAKADSDAVKAALGDVSATLPATAAQIDLLSGAWSNMNSDVTAVIATLDKLAGRNPSVEAAMSNMYKSLRDQAGAFKVGQQGAVLLDPNRLLKADGTINTMSAAGGNFYSQLTSVQSGIASGADATYRAALLATHDPVKARAELNKVVEQGVALEEKNLEKILGSKTAADKVLDAYKQIPSLIETTIVTNTEGALNSLVGLANTEGVTLGAPSIPNAAAAAAAGNSTPAASTSYGTLAAKLGMPNTGEHDGSTGSNVAAANAFTQAGADGDKSRAVANANGAPGQRWPGGVERWRSLALQALAMEGESPSELDTVLYRINLESSGNAYAINTTDSNALKGTPSKGLVQVIDPTFQGYAAAGHNQNIFDPLSNLLAGMNWAKHAYGSVHAGFGRAGGYDNGGWLEPGGVAFSKLATPEPILTTAQWKIAEMAIATHTNGSSGKTITVGDIHITVQGDPDEVQLERLRGKIGMIFKQEVERAF